MSSHYERHFPTAFALARWAQRMKNGDNPGAFFSLLANPFFLHLMGLDRPITRRPLRHPLVWLIGSSALLAGIIAGISINEIRQTVATWPNTGAGRVQLYFNTIVTPFMFAMGFIATAVPIVSFVSLCRQIANGTIEHFVMTPPGWRAILQARAAHATLRTTTLVAGMMLCAHALTWHYQFYNKNDVWIMTALLAILPFCAYAAGMISLYWALRHFHVRAFAFGGLLIYQIVLYAAVGIFVATTVEVTGIRNDLYATSLGTLLAILIFYGLGKVYWGRLMELTHGPAMEHLATGRHRRVRPFGAAPWWRIDLLRRLWPLKTWAHLRFMTNLYLLTMLVMMIPVSLMKSMGAAYVGLTAIIAGLPFFLCLTTLPRHWAEAQSSVPQSWTGEGLPDHARDIPPFVMFQILMRPWQMLFALFGIGAAGFSAIMFNLFAQEGWRFYQRGFWGILGRLIDGVLRMPAMPLLAPGVFMGGSLLTLLYLRFIIAADRRPGDASAWRLIVMPVTLTASVLFFSSLSLMSMSNRTSTGWSVRGLFITPAGLELFMKGVGLLSVMILLLATIFFPIYARLARHVLRELHEMKEQPPQN